MPMTTARITKSGSGYAVRIDDKIVTFTETVNQAQIVIERELYRRVVLLGLMTPMLAALCAARGLR
jgi:hypothetical protein